MIIFESRKTRHLGFVSLETLRTWGISLDYPSNDNVKIFEAKVSQLKKSPSSHVNANGVKSLSLYFYKPEAYFHPTYRKALAQHILDLSKAGFEVVLESDSVNLLNYFGNQIEHGLVSKDDFEVSLEVEKDGRPYFINLKYNNVGILSGIGEDSFPIGYFV